MPRLQLFRTLQAPLGALLLFASSSFCFAAEPQYALDSSFQAPTFTSFASVPRVLVLPDDRFYAFSTASGGLSPGTHRFEGQLLGNLVRFMPDGALDPSFLLDQQLGGYTITAVAVTVHGKLVVACIPDEPIDAPTRLVRLNADGSIDPSFDAGVGAMPTASARSVVHAIEADADGKLIVAGQFGDFSNSGRPSLVRLNPNGSVDQNFAPVQLQGSTALGVVTVMGIALQPDGKVLVAGGFHSVNGVNRPCVARLHPDGALDTSFVPQGFIPSSSTSRMYPSRPISSVVLQPGDAKVVIGGVFNPEPGGSMGASTQMLARLNADGTLDQSFNAHRDHPSRTCRSLVRLADGRMLVGLDRVGVARYETSGAYDTSFNANFPSVSPYRALSVAVQSTGKAIVGGTFSPLFSRTMVRANTDGTLDTAFQPGQFQRERLPERLAMRSDGRFVASGGFFDRVNNTPRAGLAILERKGSLAQLDYAHNLAIPNFLLQHDDKVLLFGNANDNDKFTCVRFNADATRDTSFNADPAMMEFQAAMQQPDGSYLLSSGESAQAVANEVLLTRMRPDGSLDPSFDLGIEEHLLVDRPRPWDIFDRLFYGANRALAVLTNGKILYHYFDRDSLHKVVLLEPDGAVDPSFHIGSAAPRATITTFPQIYDPKTGRTIQPVEGVIEPTGVGPSVALMEPDGRIIVAGQFTSYNGVPAGSIVRLNSNGSLHSTLGSGAAFASTAVTSEREPSVTEVQRDFAGRLLIVGDFDTFHGVPAPGIARLNADGSFDTTFVPPVARRATGYAFNNHSVLLREGAGRFLLVGNYGSTAGDAIAASIIRLHIPVRATEMMKAPGNGLRIQFTGVPGETYKIERTDSIASGAFSDAGARLQAAPDGTFIYEDAAAFSSLQRFYRAVTLE